MKTLVSFLLGAAMLFGAATFGLQSGSASANDRNNWRNERMRHHRHHRNRRHWRNKLSY